VQTFDPKAGKKGVDIGGKPGEPVYAAAAGDVVYSGNGLIGYGNLVIIKHDDTFLSAYAYNRKLLVKEGDRVKAGTKIAEMGQVAKGESILHFEIRRDGNPINPLRFLPRRGR
jgi:lipoprotein NlpD